MYRIGYNLFSFTGLIILLYLQFIIPSALLFNTSPTTNCISLCIIAISAVIIIASVLNYDWRSFIGITEEKYYSLVITGMNKYVRHPLYSGTMLFVTGFVILLPYFKNIFLWVLMWIYLAVGMVYEERKLLKLYGSAYKNYQKEVKKIIPFVW